MLDDSIKAQLAAYFERITQPITLVASAPPKATAYSRRPSSACATVGMAAATAKAYARDNFGAKPGEYATK